MKDNMKDNTKDRINKGINDFVSACYTFGKIGAGDFADNNFHKIVDEAWDDTKSDAENLRSIKETLEFNIAMNNANGNTEAAKVIDAYMKGWFSKLSE